MKQLPILLTLFIPLWAYAGAFGIGNTGDLAFQFDFARSTAISILKNTSPEALDSVANSTPELEFYKTCRQTMYAGALKTAFTLVKSIPDGGQFHAIARRRSDSVIEISRAEMEKLSRQNTLTSTATVAIVLHEVGHDCVFKGHAVDDNFDPLLNALAVDLIATSNYFAQTSFLDMEFVRLVKEQKPLRLELLSGASKKEITRRYLDYLGDWAYVKYKSSLPERPAAASQFYADLNTSVFLGWGRQDLAAQSAALQRIVNGVMRATYESDTFFYFNGSQKIPLTSQLSCNEIQAETSSVRCQLTTALDEIDPTLKNTVVQMQWTLDIFSNLKIERIQISE